MSQPTLARGPYCRTKGGRGRRSGNENRPGTMPRHDPDGPASLTAREWALFLLALTYALALRAWDLGATPFRVDEAESSINALSILQHGLPVDHYLGLPVYENTLTRPWPESPEYEFKDSSYSGRGLAIYHGWVPLYATAA